MSQTDLRLFVRESYPTATGELRITEHMRVAMPPQQAKAMLNVLQDTIIIYEKNFGPIGPIMNFPTQASDKEPE